MIAQKLLLLAFQLLKPLQAPLVGSVVGAILNLGDQIQ